MLAAIVAMPSARAQMAHRNKNLLEAFSASAANEKSAKDAAENGAPSSVGGPFATPPKQESILTAAERELVKDASTGPPAFARTILRPENYQGLIAAIVIVAAVSFLIGRATSGGVTAAEGAEESASVAPKAVDEQPALAATPIPLPGSVGLVSARTSEEADLAETDDALRMSAIKSELLDPANKYTITLAEYRKDRDEHLATPTLYYLLDEGLPAAMLYRGNRLLLVVGAAPRQVDLDDLLERAQTMPGPPPSNRKAEFSDAYLNKIDKIIDR